MEKKKDICIKMKNEIQDYLSYVNRFGNECAYTDRTLENIIKLAKDLKKEYDKFFKEIG